MNTDEHRLKFAMAPHLSSTAVKTSVFICVNLWLKKGKSL